MAHGVVASWSLVLQSEMWRRFTHALFVYL